MLSCYHIFNAGVAELAYLPAGRQARTTQNQQTPPWHTMYTLSKVSKEIIFM